MLKPRKMCCREGVKTPRLQRKGRGERGGDGEKSYWALGFFVVSSKYGGHKRVEHRAEKLDGVSGGPGELGFFFCPKRGRVGLWCGLTQYRIGHTGPWPQTQFAHNWSSGPRMLGLGDPSWPLGASANHFWQDREKSRGENPKAGGRRKKQKGDLQPAHKRDRPKGIRSGHGGGTEKELMLGRGYGQSGGGYGVVFSRRGGGPDGFLVGF